ncbi:MAG: hypothetical protein P1V97_30925 [Planctomycetota bacterium]|nr:hypothetical protein [Planctomycetota bacterium]
MKSQYWVPSLVFSILVGFVTVSHAKDKDPKADMNNPVVAKVNSATVMLKNGYGKLNSLTELIASKTKLNVVCDPNIRLKSFNYNFPAKSYNAHKLLTDALKKQALKYEGFSGVIYISKANSPNRLPPLIDLDNANDEAKELLEETVSIALSSERLKDAFEILSDVTGLEVTTPSKKEQEDGRLKPDVYQRINLNVEEISAKDCLYLVMRQMQLALSIQGTKVVFWSYSLTKGSAGTQKIIKALGEPCLVKVTAKTLGELGKQLAEKYKFIVFVPEELAQVPVKAPPGKLSLRSTLFLAPGIGSGIDHRIVGDGLLFEKRSGRRRPPEQVDISKADTTLLITLQTRKLAFTGGNRPLSVICKELDASFGSIKITCDKEIEKLPVSFKTKKLRLGAIIEHIARVTDTKASFKKNVVHFSPRP